MRNSGGNGNSASSSRDPSGCSTNVQDVADEEKIEKLTPPGTGYAPKTKGCPIFSVHCDGSADLEFGISSVILVSGASCNALMAAGGWIPAWE